MELLSSRKCPAVGGNYPGPSLRNLVLFMTKTKAGARAGCKMGIKEKAENAENEENEENERNEGNEENEGNDRERTKRR